MSPLATAVASYLAEVFANSAIASFIVASSAIASSAIAGSTLRAPPLRALDVQAALTGMVGVLEFRTCSKRRCSFLSLRDFLLEVSLDVSNREKCWGKEGEQCEREGDKERKGLVSGGAWF